MESADPTAPQLAPGDLVRWIDPARRTKPLGIVLAPVREDVVCVLMADRDGSTDVEAFVARVEDTGVPAPELALESVEIVDGGDPGLVAFLRDQARRVEAEIGP